MQFHTKKRKRSNVHQELYKTLLKTGTNNDDYRDAKANFKRYRDILRNSIKRAKMLYYINSVRNRRMEFNYISNN